MIVYSPNEHDFAAGMTQNSVFLKGPKEWTDAIAKVIGSNLPDVICLISNEASITDWDVKYACDVDILSINFRGLQSDTYTLLPLKELARFPPPTYIYIDGRLKNKALLEGIIGKCHVTKLDSPEGITKIIEDYFAFLTELKTPAEKTEKTPRQKRKKEV